MVITIFVRLEFDRIMQKELIDTNFVNFGEGLVFVILRYIKTCKKHTFPVGTMEASFFVLETQEAL